VVDTSTSSDEGGGIVIVADRGATVHVVSKEMAEQLAVKGLVAAFTPADEGSDKEIVYGRQSARERIIGTLAGSGPRPIIRDVQVVENASCGLISDRQLTQQGYVVYNTDTYLVVLWRSPDGGWLPVLTAQRDLNAPEGSSESLWAYNAEQLFSAQVPDDGGGDTADEGSDADDPMELEVGAASSLSASASAHGVHFDVGSATPRYSAEHVRRARIWLKNWGNGSARSKANSIERGALVDVPDYLTPALLRYIAAKKDNPLYAMCKRKIPSCGGSGVHTVQVGKRVSFDDLGKFRKSTWGATYVVLFMDIASRWIVAYAMSEKTTVLDGLVQYIEQAQSFGHEVKEAQTDATSTVGTEFIAKAQEHGLQIVQSAAEDQRTNPVEANWRTLKRNIALLLLSQDNFSEEDWMLAVMRAVADSNTTVHEGATKTPLELFTNRTPSFTHIAAFPFGALVTTPRTGVLEIGDPPFELAIHVAPILTGPKAHVVVLLEKGASQPVVRAHCELVESTSKELTVKEIEALAPEVDAQGNVTRYRAVREGPLTMENLVQRFEEQTMSPAPSTGDPLHAGEQQERSRTQGRLTRGGAYTSQNRLQASGKRLRSACGADKTMEELMDLHKARAAAMVAPVPAAPALAPPAPGLQHMHDPGPAMPPQGAAEAPAAAPPEEEDDDGDMPVYWHPRPREPEQPRDTGGLNGVYWTGAARTERTLPVPLSIDGIQSYPPLLHADGQPWLGGPGDDLDPDLVAAFLKAFGPTTERPREEHADWLRFLQELLHRPPTADEIRRTCTRNDPGHDPTPDSLPHGDDDEHVARLVHKLTGELPDEEDWAHADAIYASTGRTLSVDDLTSEQPLPYTRTLTRFAFSGTCSKQDVVRGDGGFCVLKARVRHDADSPSLGMIKRCTVLQETWDHARAKELQDNLAEGTLVEIAEDVARGMTQLHPQWVFKTKRDGTRKVRLTTNGQGEDKASFVPGSLYAPTLPVDTLLYLIAFAAYHGLEMYQFDVKRAFPRHNAWDDPACKNKRDLAMRLGAWESGRPDGMWVQLGTNTQGTYDAGRMFSDISDAALLGDGCMQRATGVGMQCMFYRHRGADGLLLLGKNVDNFLVLATPNPDGTAMVAELESTFAKQDWEMTKETLGLGSEPFDIHSLVINKGVDAHGRPGLLVTQPNHVAKVRAEFFGSDVVAATLPETMLPLGYSPEASAADPRGVSSLEYQRKMGLVAWLAHTMKHTAAFSLLQSEAGIAAGPSQTDMDALHHLAGYAVRAGEEGAGLWYPCGPNNAHVRVVPPLYGFADAGSPGHVNSAAQHGRLLFLGDPAAGGAAFLVRSNKNGTRLGDSVPVDEARALLDLSKDAILYSDNLEEVTTGKAVGSDESLPLLPPPILGTNPGLSAVLASTDPGTMGDPLTAQAAALNAQRTLPADRRRLPVTLYEDNAAVATAVQRAGLVQGLSGMRHISRLLHCLSSWEDAGLISVLKCTSAEQRANSLTKVIAGPLETTRAAMAICGTQPALTARLERQVKRWPGSRQPRASATAGDDDGDGGTVVPGGFAAMAATAVLTICSAAASWASPRTSSMLTKLGFGQAPGAPSVGEHMQDTRRDQRVKTGLGIPNMLLINGMEARLAKLTLENTRANRSPPVHGDTTACELIEDLIRASRGLEVAAQAASSAEELAYIRATQQEAMQARLQPTLEAAGTKRTVDALDATGDGRSRSEAAKSARNAKTKARKQARIDSSSSNNSNNNT